MNCLHCNHPPLLHNKPPLKPESTDRPCALCNCVGFQTPRAFLSNIWHHLWDLDKSIKLDSEANAFEYQGLLKARSDVQRAEAIVTVDWAKSLNDVPGDITEEVFAKDRVSESASK